MLRVLIKVGGFKDTASISSYTYVVMCFLNTCLCLLNIVSVHSDVTRDRAGQVLCLSVLVGVKDNCYQGSG